MSRAAAHSRHSECNATESTLCPALLEDTSTGAFCCRADRSNAHTPHNSATNLACVSGAANSFFSRRALCVGDSNHASGVEGFEWLQMLVAYGTIVAGAQMSPIHHKDSGCISGQPASYILCNCEGGHRVGNRAAQQWRYAGRQACLLSNCIAFVQPTLSDYCFYSSGRRYGRLSRCTRLSKAPLFQKTPPPMATGSDRGGEALRHHGRRPRRATQ